MIEIKRRIRIFLESKRNANFLAIAIIFLCSLTMLRTLYGFTYVYWDHILASFNPGMSIIKDYYVWDYATAGGRYFVYLPHLPYHFLSYIFSLILPIDIVNGVVFWLLFLISGLSMYFFVRKTINFDGESERILSSFVPLIAALVYMFNSYWTLKFSTAPLVIFILTFLPLVMFLSREALMSADISKRRAIKYSILTSLTTILMTSGLAELPAALAAALFVAFYLIFLGILKHKIKSLIFVFFLISLFSLVVNLWWIFPNLLHKSVNEAINKSGQYTVDSDASLRLGSEYTIYSRTFRGNGYYEYPDKDLIGTPLTIQTSKPLLFDTNIFILISILTPIVGFGALLSKKIKQKSEILIFAAATVFFVPILLVGYNPPFDALIKWLTINMPLFVFRRPSLYMFILHFIYAYMFSLGILFLYYITKRIKQSLQYIGYTVIAVLLILVIVVNAYPQWLGYTAKINLYDETGKEKSVSPLTKVPDYVKDLIKYVNDDPSEGSALILPKVGSVRAYDWDYGYFGFDIYYLSLERPVLTTYRYDKFQPNDGIYTLINNAIQENDNKTFTSLLKILNVKYIIVAEDALCWGTDAFDINQINYFLSKNDDVGLIKKFGKHVLYKVNEETTGSFYPVSNSIAFTRQQNKSTSPNLATEDQKIKKDFLQLNSFLKDNNPKYNVMVDNFAAILPDGQNYSAINIDVEKYSPVKFGVKVFENKHPFILTSSVFYDSNWIAKIDGKPIEHIKTNNFFNGWIVDKSGNFVITVEYSKQRIINFFIYISGISILMLLFILGFLMHKKYD